jgi:hypothetical protein
MAAYLIFTHKVTDADTLNNVYLPKAVETLGPYAPEILIVDENIEVIEGDTGTTRPSTRPSSTCGWIPSQALARYFATASRDNRPDR